MATKLVQAGLTPEHIFNTVNELVNEQPTTLESFGAVGDFYLEGGGLNPSPTDDTTAIASALLVGGKLTGTTGKSYLVKKWLVARLDNTSIDFNHSTLVWENDGTNVNPVGVRSNGIISFKGVAEGSTINASTIAANDSVVVATGSIDAAIVIGSYVTIQTINSYPENDGRVHYDYLAKVLDIVEGGGTVTLTTEEKHKWSFVGDVLITKVVPIVNPSIKNITLVDTTSSTHEDAVCGVNASLSLGFSTNKVDMDEQFNPVVTVSLSREVSLDKGNSKDAKATTGGRGYYAQIGASRNIDVSGISLVRGRHVIDFTSSARAKVSNCHGEDNAETEFSFHGEWEHDITIEDSTGSVGVAISGEQFGEMAENIILRRVKGKYFFNYRDAYNVTLYDCEFEIGSTNTYNLNMYNSRITEYARFSGSAHPSQAGIVSNGNVHGGYIKGEQYSGANFIPEGVNVDFYDTHVVSLRDSPTTPVNLERLQMFGGKFEMGFANPISSSTWLFNGTNLDGVCFAFEAYILDGFRLVLDSIEQHIIPSVGLIRNRIPAEGLRDPTTFDQSTAYRATIVCRNFRLKPDVSGGKVLDFDKCDKCLNLDVNVQVDDGLFIADLRSPTADVGNIQIRVLKGLGFSGGITTEDEYKHRDRLLDLDVEFGFEGQSLVEEDNPQSVRTYLLDHVTNLTGLLAYNYPLDKQAKGILVVTANQSKTTVKQEITYSFEITGALVADTFSRIYRHGSGWSSWKKHIRT
jgi:hypothetical protein